MSLTDRIFYSNADLDKLGIFSRRTRYRLRKKGEFPQPVQVGGRQIWRREDIDEWKKDPNGWAARHAA